MTHAQFIDQLERSLEEDLLSQEDFDRLTDAVAAAWIAEREEDDSYCSVHPEPEPNEW
jgi:hypothetical protein